MIFTSPGGRLALLRPDLRALIFAFDPNSGASAMARIPVGLLAFS